MSRSFSISFEQTHFVLRSLHSTIISCHRKVEYFRPRYTNIFWYWTTSLFQSPTLEEVICWQPSCQVSTVSQLICLIRGPRPERSVSKLVQILSIRNVEFQSFYPGTRMSIKVCWEAGRIMWRSSLSWLSCKYLLLV